MLLFPHNRVKTSAGVEQLSLALSYCIKSPKFSSTIMSLPFTLRSRRIALHFKKAKHSDLSQEELREEIMSLCRNMQSHTTDPLKNPLYSEQIRGVCLCECSLPSFNYSINKLQNYNIKPYCDENLNKLQTVLIY